MNENLLGESTSGRCEEREGKEDGGSRQWPSSHLRAHHLSKTGRTVDELFIIREIKVLPPLPVPLAADLDSSVA